MNFEINWTEEKAIKAQEENRQVMMPGLREQAAGQRVFVDCEYAPLKGVILGNPESMYLPDPYHPSWYASMKSLPREKLDWMAANRGKHVKEVDEALWEKMCLGLDELANVYKQAGAHVIQTKAVPPDEVINYTAGWLGECGRHWSFHAQAFGEVFGNLIVNFHETQPSIRYNCIEYIEAFMGLFKNDPESTWLAMPDPLPMPSYYGAGLSPGDIRIFPNKLLVIGLGVFGPAHIQDQNKPRSSGNEMGAEILKRILAPYGWRVEIVYFDASFGYHIDTLMPLVREGMLAVHEDALLTPLPAEVADWEKVPITREEYVIGAGNSVPLSPDSHAVTVSARQYIAELEKRQINVVPVPFDDVYHFTGSGMHCATFSYWREF